MRNKRVLGWVTVSMALCGWLARDADAWRAAAESDGASLLLGLTAGYLCFLWYCADSDERGFRRPRWLGAAIILLTPAAVPYYLVRTRAGRARLQALLAYAGCAGLCMLSAWDAAALRWSAWVPA